MLDWLLAAGRGSTKLVEPPYVPPFKVVCVYITQTGLGAGTINNTTPPLARPSVSFFRGPKLLLQFIDSYHDFLSRPEFMCHASTNISPTWTVVVVTTISKA